MGEKSPNRRRSWLELPGNYQAALDSHAEGLGATLNERFQTINRALETRAGLRGEVQQKAAMQMSGNQAVNLADPQKPEDIVNFRTLKDWSRCSFLAGILDKSPEWEELVSDVEVTGSAALSRYPFAFSNHLVQPHTVNTNSPIATANDVMAFPVLFPTDMVISKLVFELVATSAGKLYSVGLYSIDKTTKLIDSGVQSANSAGIKNISVGPVTLTAGRYLVAFTADSTTPTFRLIDSDANIGAMFNFNHNIQGVDATPSTAGALPSSLGTLTASSRDAIMVFFE